MFNLCSKDRSCDHYSCERHSYGELRELRQTRFLLQVCPGREQWWDHLFMGHMVQVPSTPHLNVRDTVL